MPSGQASFLSGWPAVGPSPPPMHIPPPHLQRAFAEVSPALEASALASSRMHSATQFTNACELAVHPLLDGSLGTGPAVKAAGVASDALGKGPISQLQEYVQSSRQFPVPPHRPILQFSYDTRMGDSICLEFRSIVAFFLEGVPHHVAGSWRSSKKAAQRDTCEGALQLFVASWGEHLLEAAAHHGQREPVQAQLETGRVDTSSRGPGKADVVRTLEHFTGGDGLRWNLQWEGATCQAIVEVNLRDVCHKFPGAVCESEDAARADTARRVLWYLQCPGYEDLFEPSSDFHEKLGTPLLNWAISDLAEGSACRVAERKTLLMRVQNRLQQTYARQLESGKSVWEWRYQTESPGPGCQPWCRATVRILVTGHEFHGDWHLGQREAQIDVCQHLSAFLNDEAMNLQ